MPKDRHLHRRHSLEAGLEAKPYYYIVIHTLGKRPLLDSLYTGRCVINVLKDHHDRAFTIAFAILPDCLHWLVLPRGATPLPHTIARVRSQSTQRYQALTGSTSPLWHRAWDERAIGENENIRDIALHIITSPKRAGLVSSISDYPHWDAGFMGETQAGELWQGLLKD